MLPNLAAGLDSILFAINIDNKDLDIGSSALRQVSQEDEDKILEPQTAQSPENVSSSS